MDRKLILKDKMQTRNNAESATFAIVPGFSNFGGLKRS